MIFRDRKLNHMKNKKLSELMKGRRYCMDPETTYLFLAFKKDIEKYNYRCIDSYTLAEFLEDAESEQERTGLTEMYRIMTKSNKIAEIAECGI